MPCHIFIIEKSDDNELIITINDNEKYQSEGLKMHIIATLTYELDTDNWFGEFQNIKTKILKPIPIISRNIHNTVNEKSWVRSAELTAEQIKNLPKRKTSKQN